MFVLIVNKTNHMNKNNLLVMVNSKWMTCLKLIKQQSTDELLLQKLDQCFAQLDQYDTILKKEEVEYNGIKIGSLVVADIIEEEVKTILLVDDIQDRDGKIFLQASQAICKVSGKWYEIRKMVSRYDGENLKDVRLINDDEFEEWFAFGEKETQILKVGFTS